VDAPNSKAEEIVVRLLVGIPCIAFMVLLHLFADKQVLQRRALAVRLGRQLQTSLRLPESIRVFADIDPGMMDNYRNRRDIPGSQPDFGHHRTRGRK
jgi:hypothetical protein